MRLLPLVAALAASSVASCEEAPLPLELSLGQVRFAAQIFSFVARISPRQMSSSGIEARLVVSGNETERSLLLYKTVCFLQVQDKSGRPVDTVEKRQSTHSEAEMLSSCKALSKDSCGADLRARRTLVRGLKEGDADKIQPIQPGPYSVRAVCLASVGETLSATDSSYALQSEWVRVELAK